MNAGSEQLASRPVQLDELFVDEALAHLRRIESELADIGAAQPGRELLQSMFRSMHSLKGTSAALEVTSVTELVHRAETLLDRLLKGRLQWSPEVLSLMGRVCWSLESLITHPDHQAQEDLMSALEIVIQSGPAVADGSMPVPVFEWEIVLGPLDADDDAAAARELFDELPELGVVRDESSPRERYLRWLLTSSSTAEVLTQVLSLHVPADKLLIKALTPAVADKPVKSLSTNSTIRVSVAHLRELDLHFLRLKQAQDQLQRLLEHEGLLSQASVRALVKTCSQSMEGLRETLDASRQVRASEMLKRFPSLIHNLASKLGKQIDIRIEGAEMDVDRFVMEQISDALLHLLRNSCDHGIEMPAQRLVSGKSPQGTLKLEMRSTDGRLQVEVQDDGAGLSRGKILARAQELGIDLPEAASDEAVWALILAPGFSTASSVTDLSGRGVGLDVVRCAVEGLGGQLRIRSVAGQGTTFVLDMPLHLPSLPHQQEDPTEGLSGKFLSMDEQSLT